MHHDIQNHGGQEDAMLLTQHIWRSGHVMDKATTEPHRGTRSLLFCYECVLYQNVHSSFRA